MNTRWRKGLRRATTVVAGATVTVLISAGAALAFPSGGKPGTTGPNHIEWTGQGASSISSDPTSAQCTTLEPSGNAPGTPYLLWVFTTDGGSVSTLPTDPPPLPVLHLTGSQSGLPLDVQPGDGSSSSTVKFVSPYFTPDTSTLQASASFNVLSTGNGGWNLVISHGCAPPSTPPQAQPPTVTKNAAGAYTTTWTWGIKKYVLGSAQANAPPGGSATFNYEVDVTHVPSNGNITVAGTITASNPNSASVAVQNITDQLSGGVGNCQLTNPPSTLQHGDTQIPYTCTLPDNADLSNLTNTVTVSWGDQMVGGAHLAADSATFTTPTIQFQQNVVNDCATITDPQAPAGILPATVCSGDPSPAVFKYSVTWPAGTPGKCTPYTNTATFTTSGQNMSNPPVTGSDHATVSVCTGADLTLTKTATPSFDRTYHWGILKTVDHNTIDTPAGPNNGPGTATANYNVAVTHDGGTDSNWQVTGKITVSNPNTFEAVTANVTDAIDNGGNCTVGKSAGGDDPANAVIPASGSVDFPYTCTYPISGPSSLAYNNTATASWDQGAAATADGSASSNTVSGTFAGVAPTTIHNGTVHVTDDNAPASSNLPADVTYQQGTLDPTTGLYTINFPYLVTYNDPAGTCTSHQNTASFVATDNSNVSDSSSQTVQVCVGADLGVTKTATPSFNVTYGWGITKIADQKAIDNTGPATFNYTVSVTHDAGTPGGWVVQGNITVANPNDWEPVTLTGVIDPTTTSGGNCTVGGSPAGTVLTPKGSQGGGDSATFPYTCTFSSAPSSPDGTNYATATWDPTAAHSLDGSATGSADFHFGQVNPTIVNGSVTVSDPQAPNPPLPATVSYTDPSPKKFTYPVTYSGDKAGTCTPHHNVATFTATDDSSVTGQASADVLHCIGVDLQVSKTANPSFDRTYLWNINKSVDKTLITSGGTVNYMVTVNQTGVSDGNYKVKGTITVTNPNDWEGIELTGLSDAVDNGGTCLVGATPALPLVIAPSGSGGNSATFTYTCTYSSKPGNLSGTNTAKATWTGVSPDTTGTGQAGFVFGSPTNLINKTITVKDPLAPSNPLGQVTATDPPAAPASATFKYSKTLASPPGSCATVNNTATIVETGQTASQSVRVSCNTGALTMGFWQNKNGQAIITGANQGALQTWLKQYNPFQDAPSTGLATYVSNIIKAANASGASMNAMLRAQMLSTALDVYFSDPALGGNKIGAPGPVGAVKIDLTKVCHMIDGSGGTATCSGTYEDTSSAFGGTSPQTVLQLLSYAASQASSPNGSTWYAQNKTIQGLAKDTFDAINNQVAFGP